MILHNSNRNKINRTASYLKVSDKTSFCCVSVAICMFSSHLMAGSNDEQTNRGLSFNLASSYFYNDNLTRSSVSPDDAYAFLVRPELALDFGSDSSNFRIAFLNETVKHEGSSEDNYSDTSLDLSADFSLTSRHRINLNIGLADTHEGRGQGFNTGQGNLQREVDTLSRNDYGINYTFGREGAKAQLEFYYNIQQVDYDARLDNLGNDVTRIRDRQDNSYGVSLSYQVGAKTDLIANIQRTELEYDIETGFGSTVDSILLGLSWDATAKTTGRFQLGTQTRDFLLGGSEDTNIWSASVDWAFSESSIIRFNTSKTGESSIGIGNSRDVSSTSINWVASWGRNWQSTITFSTENTDFFGSDEEFDSQTFAAELDYSISDRLNANLYYSSTNRDSDIDSSLFGYDQIIYGINISYDLF